MLRLLIIAAAVAGVSPEVAHACSRGRTSVFALVDEADTVGVGRVVAGGARLTQTLRGRRGRVRIRVSGTSCDFRMRRGARGLFILEGRERVGGDIGFIEDADPALVDAVRRYIQTPVPDRRQLLVELAMVDGPVAVNALTHLTGRPDLLADLNATERARLVARVADASTLELPVLAQVLARIGEVAAIQPLIDRLGDLSLEQIIVPLEVLTNHRQPVGPDFGDEYGRIARWRRRMRPPIVGRARRGSQPTALVRARRHWSDWLASADLSNLFAAGFRARGVTPPDPNDRVALARVVREGPDIVSRIVAFERCRLLRRELLESHLTFGVSPHLWPRWGDSCEADRVIEMAVGESVTHPAADVRSHSVGGSLVEVRVSSDHLTFRANSVGSTTILLIMTDGSTQRIIIRSRRG